MPLSTSKLSTLLLCSIFSLTFTLSSFAHATPAPAPATEKQKTSVKEKVIKKQYKAIDKKTSSKAKVKNKYKDTKNKAKTKSKHKMHVNINTASEQELIIALKGIGSKKAQAIIKYRAKHGKFKSNKDLLAVTGIGQKLLDNNSGRIKFSGSSVVKLAKKKAKANK